MNNILIVGDDKIGRKLISNIEAGKYQINVYIDKSSTNGRVLNLLVKGRIKLRHLIKMALSLFLAPDFKIKQYPSIVSNRELLDVIRKEACEKVFFFRAGLIIDNTVISSGVELLNVHCADILEYGGLASIARALDNKAYNQNATLHRIIKNIDSGEVIAAEPYEMTANNPYFKNEEIAYNAGIKLILKNIISKNA